MNRKVTTLVLLSSLCAMAAVASAAELARINGKVITVEEFNRRFREDQKTFQLAPRTKQDVLNDLVKRELVIQEARRLGMDKDPEVIDRMNTVLFYALVEKRLNKEFDGIQISDEEAKAFYAKNPEIRTSHIFVGVAPDASAEDQKKALEKIRKIQAEQLRPGKKSFAEVAQRLSEGPSAPMGGDIDYQTRDKLDPNYYDAAMKLKPGQVSGIVRSQFGYHLIKLTAVRPWADADQAKIKRLVFEEKRKQVFESYVAQLRAKAKVTTNPRLLSN